MLSITTHTVIDFTQIFLLKCRLPIINTSNYIIYIYDIYLFNNTNNWL